MNMMKLQAQRDRMKRLRVLQVLDQVRPQSIGHGMILKVLEDEPDLELTSISVKQALDYLEQRNLVVITSKANPAVDGPGPWMAKISADGIDYLDGHGDDIAGVARPQEFGAGL